MEGALRMNAWPSLCISTLSAGRPPRVFTICSRSSGSRSSLESSTANASITAPIDAVASLADLSFASIPCLDTLTVLLCESQGNAGNLGGLLGCLHGNLRVLLRDRADELNYLLLAEVPEVLDPEQVLYVVLVHKTVLTSNHVGNDVREAHVLSSFL